MTLQTLYDDYAEKFFNFPIFFNDNKTGDGTTKSFQLTQSPLSSHWAYVPIITVNATLQTEDVHYTVDYETWVINFVVAPWTWLAIVFKAYHQKCNLDQFIRYYHRASKKIKNIFPIEALETVLYTDVSWATENDVIEEIDLTASPFSDWDWIAEVFQNKDDYRSVEMLKRADTILLKVGSNAVIAAARDWSVSDYLADKIWRGKGKISYLTYPYWIKGNKKYTTIDTATYPGALALPLTIEIPDDGYEQMMLLIWMFMYMSIMEWTQKVRSSSLKTQEIIQINWAIRTINFQLLDDLKMHGVGKGQVPQTFQKVVPYEPTNQ